MNARIRNAKIIAVDIDLTLTNEECWTEKECLLATPKWEIVEAVRSIFHEKYIVLSTSRKWETLAVPTLNWLTKYNIPYNAIDFRKTCCDLLVDDKAITPGDFLKALKAEPYP